MTDLSDKAHIPDPCNEVPIPFPCGDLGRRGPINEHEVKCAQQEWCLGLLEISRKYHAVPQQDYRGAARAFITKLYDFGPRGQVFFRPTLAEFPNNFRTTFDGTLEYFVGKEPEPGQPDDPNDGFAKKNLISAKFSNRLNEKTCGIQLHGTTAMAMGNVFLIERKGNKDEDIVVDKVFVYRKDDSTNHHLKLIVHMSALRNEPGKPAVE